MNVFVDTSVWSLALRRDAPPDVPEVAELRRALEAGAVYCTGLVLQELLQGFAKPKAHRQIVDRFAALPLLVPDRDDHIHAADIRNRCRRKGVQAGTIDALLAQLCVRYDLTMLTTDKDFDNMASVVALSVWRPNPSQTPR
ncbi:MAG: PIN domain-containing protein [Gammaproteobacteria bacterium]|nr:PIN domain-containing protein [Gammaproteobacteria bacterium]MDH4252970.1 PIN domain-containing protein [Gammaproteobacteria bacterium]MDH5308344.1 PIN domain-containing protein [Gammaproteobacteria bacterium]